MSKKRKNKKHKKKKHKYKNKFVETDKIRQCQFYTKDGEKCLRDATYTMDLTSGITFYNVKIVPEKECCFACTQHFKIAFLGGLVKAHSLLLPIIFNKTYGEDLSLAAHDILDQKIQDYEDHKIFGVQIFRMIGEYLNNKSMEKTGKKSELGQWLISN